MAETARPRRRSRFHRAVDVRDPWCRVDSRGSAIVVDDRFGEWRGVISVSLEGHLGERVIVSTAEGNCLGRIDDVTNEVTLVIGLEPAPFLL